MDRAAEPGRNPDLSTRTRSVPRAFGRTLKLTAPRLDVYLRARTPTPRSVTRAPLTARPFTFVTLTWSRPRAPRSSPPRVVTTIRRRRPTLPVAQPPTLLPSSTAATRQ